MKSLAFLAVLLLGLCLADHAEDKQTVGGVVPGTYKELCRPGYIWVEWRKKCMRANRGAVAREASKKKCRSGFIWVEWQKKCVEWRNRCPAGFIWVDWRKRCLRADRGVVRETYKEVFAS